jgi:DNA polymerase-3 subunit beta
MKFSIKRKDIRAMLHLAAKKDIRYYLQGVNVVRDNRGTYLEATDGHILGRLFISNEKSDTKTNIVLPTESLLKLKGTKKQGDELLCFNVNGLAVECISNDSTMKFSAHEARFPDADRVIPLVIKDEDIAPAVFNPDLLIRFMDASEEIWGKRQVPQILQRGDKSAIVSFSQMDDLFVGVIMPMTKDHKAKIPAWCYTPSTKPVETPETV